MREIKFRAWDKENEEYINGYDVLLRYDGSAVSRYALGALDTDMPVNVIVEQYTGLKDRNGKEIYEGDIVRKVCQIGYGMDGKRVEYPLNGRPILIEWDKAGSGWSYFLNGCGLCRKMGWAAPEEVEVIGNIHENPELLKKQ